MRLAKGLILALLFCFITSLCSAGEIASIRMNKALVSPEEAKFYFDILDSQGHAEQDTVPDEITAVIGSSRATINEIKPFSLTGEGIAYVLLLDLSPALQEEFPHIQEMLTTLVGKMSPPDQVLLMTLGSETTVVQNFTADKEKVKNALASLSAAAKPTLTLEGLSKALHAAADTDIPLPARRAVILIAADAQMAPNSTVRQQIFEKLLQERMPIYVVNYARQPDKDSQLRLDVLGELARHSGGAYYQSQMATPAAIYTDILKASKAGFIAYMSHPPLSNTSVVSHVQLSVKNGDKIFTDTIETKPVAGPLLLPPDKEKKTATQPFSVLPLLYIAPALAAGLLLVFHLYRRKQNAASKKTAAREIQAALDTAAATVAQLPIVCITGSAPPAKTSSPQCLHILLTTLKNPSQTFPLQLTDSLLIGSNKAHSHLSIADKDISPKHCELSAEAGKLYITDLSSSSGTFVNGTAIKHRIQLHDGDVLRLGQTELRFTF